MMSLDEKAYAKYLSQAYYIKTLRKLNLRNPKTFNEKIQWLKLFDNKPEKSELTDKVLVRDWIKEKIGEEYLKPVLQICNSFDEINFEKLPDRFIIKCNHGCKWNVIVKKKQNFLEEKIIYKIIKTQFDEWLTQSFFGWSDFELQYKNILPKILIEPLLSNESNKYETIEIFCFNGKPLIVYFMDTAKKEDGHIVRTVSAFDDNLNSIDLKFRIQDELINKKVNDNVKDAFELSKILAADFKFVRVDWFIYENKLYFEEMTFTPCSGFYQFVNEYENWDLKLGKMLNLKGN